MTYMTNSIRYIALLTIMISSVGCASMDQHRDANPEPDERLDQLLSLYKQAQKQGQQCREIKWANNATTDCERVIREMERLSIEFPRNSRILMANALVNYDTGKKDKAQYQLDQLLAMSDDYPNAALLRSQLALEAGNSNLSKSVLERQIMITPDNSDLREALAAVHYTRGAYAEARKSLNIAGRLGASGWRLSYHHGLIHEAEQEWVQACSYYSIALDQKHDYRPALARLIGLGDKPGCDSRI